jgi:hypothetical protein
MPNRGGQVGSQITLMKYTRKPLVLDIRRVEPVGDEVDNMDEVHAFLFNTSFEANHFYSRNSRAC